ncbi:hypothetical protein [Acetivibrio cellulolyticus]|uniref:hypothetical protein n=1 Tax=Acetivibrio cellulolyticus TaxID=35830 RepID=UPI0001E2D468|nr:hypothetical protein [Acetivibrio cellulolyticus]
MKKLVIPVIVVMFMFYTVACSMLGSTTQKYLGALNNTQKADTMQSKTESKITIDLSKASDEAKKNFENFKDITFNVDETVDNKSKRSETNCFIGFGKYSWGTKLYIDGDKAFLKVNDKYAKMTPQDNGTIVSADGKINKEYQELGNELATIWKDTVQKEILTGEGNFIESTPDGDVKITQLSLELNDEKSKKILDSLAGVLSGSEIAKKTAIENVKKYGNYEKSDEEEKKEVINNISEWFDKLPENMKDYKEKFSIENLKLTAKIDKDSYIIDETFHGEIVIKYEGEIRISFDINTTRWNINREVNVNIPEISEKDLMNESNFDEEMDETFSELFGKQDKQ